MNKEETLAQLAEYLDGSQACNSRTENGKFRWDCDKTNKHILAWMKAHHIDRLPIPYWFCDCEVLLNFDSLLEEDAEERYSDANARVAAEDGDGEVGEDDWMVSLEDEEITA